jgi:hypothetical protein
MDNIGSVSADVEAWTLVNYLEEGGFPTLLWDTLKDFGYTAYPEYSTREVMTTCQLLRCKVKVKISMCPTNPAWEEWECKAQGRNLADTGQKAALEALTTFCGKHPDEVADSTAKVIPIHERHTVPCVEREAFLPAQSNSHYSPNLVTSVRFSEAMDDTYRQMVGETVTPSFKGKTECIDHVCARIKLHTRLDIVNTKISATRIKSYYKP